MTINFHHYVVDAIIWRRPRRPSCGARVAADGETRPGRCRRDAGDLCLLYAFHDRFWYPPDEGNYAHVAQRILRGETLNLQVQDVHPGYISFVNAAALRVFGADLVSLRYPLVLAGLLQAAVLFFLFPREDPWRAAVATIALTALGAIQFLNPTAHWYCLALTWC